MRPEQLDAIRARAEAATEGPWETVPTVGNAVVSPDGDGYWSDVADRIETEADAEFIAHAREDVPALLDEVERLRAERDALWAEAESKSCLRCTERVRAERDRAHTDRDTWRQRWQQLMRDHEEAVRERDRLAAVVDRVRALVEEWERTDPASGPFPDRVALDVDTEVLDPLRAALEGTDS